jgi:hypothetical protein
MIANMSAFALARRWRPISVYEALLLQDGFELPHGTPPVEPPNGAELGAGEAAMDGRERQGSAIRDQGSGVTVPGHSTSHAAGYIQDPEH